MRGDAEKFGFGERFWAWLKYGKHRNSASFGFYLEAPKNRWWQVPSKFIATLHRYRSIIPTPLTYLMIAGLGTLIGIVAHILFGLWWWIFPLLFVAIGWIIFLTSIWWRPLGFTQNLQADLVQIVNPEKAWALRQEKTKRAFESTELPLFEIPGWEGEIRLGGWQASGDTVTSVNVSFFASDAPPSAEHGPLIQVGSMTKRDLPGDEEIKAHIRNSLTAEVQQALRADQPIKELTADDLENPEMLQRWEDQTHKNFEEALSIVSELEWTPAAVVINDNEISAQQISVSEASGTFCTYNNVWVYLFTPTAAIPRISQMDDRSILFESGHSPGW